MTHFKIGDKVKIDAPMSTDDKRWRGVVVEVKKMQIKVQDRKCKDAFWVWKDGLIIVECK